MAFWQKQAKPSHMLDQGKKYHMPFGCFFFLVMKIKSLFFDKTDKTMNSFIDLIVSHWYELETRVPNAQCHQWKWTNHRIHGPQECGSHSWELGHVQLHLSAGTLRGAVWFRLHKIRRVWLVRPKNSRGKWYGHDAQCLGLKELHGSSDVFFHQLGHLLLCAVGWPLLPSSLTVSSFDSLSLSLHNDN